MEHKTDQEWIDEFEDKAVNTLRDDCWLTVCGSFDEKGAVEWLKTLIAQKNKEIERAKATCG